MSMPDPDIRVAAAAEAGTPGPETPDAPPSPRASWPWRAMAAQAGLALVGVVLLLSVVARERTLYEWDQLTYWTATVATAARLTSDPWAVAVRLDHSLRYDDYNLLPAIGPAAVATVAGPGRVAYVGAVAGLYGLTAVLAWGWLGRRVTGDSGGGAAAGALFVLPLVLSPNLWTPVQEGYPDVGGLALAATACALYFGPAGRTDAAPVRSMRSSTGRCVGRLAATGAVLAVLVLFRRWYLFWAVAFVAVAFVDTLAGRWAAGRARPGRAAGAAALTAGLVGATAAAVGVVLAWPMPWTILHTDYAAAYAAYRAEGGYAASLAEGVANLARQFGLLPLTLCGVAVAACLLDPARRRPTAFVVAVGTLAVLAFTRTNVLGLGHQHVYLLFLTLLWPVSLWLTAPARTRARAAVKTAAVLGVAGVNFAHAFAAAPVAPPMAVSMTTSAVPLLSDLRIRPAVRGDLDAVAALLDRLAVARGPYAIYVLASGPVLNQSQLKAADLSLGRPVPAVAHIGPTADVDLRDGFPAPLLRAGYVVVATPVQYHLRPGDQHVVGVPAEAFLSGGPFAAAFSRWPETFPLDGGVTAVVFERQRPTTLAEAQDLLDRLRAADPVHAARYRLPVRPAAPPS